MTPKEKSQKLIAKYSSLTITSHKTDSIFLPSRQFSKQCASIVVDEIMKITSESYDIDHINWWKEVKQEIEKL